MSQKIIELEKEKTEESIATTGDTISIAEIKKAKENQSLQNQMAASLIERYENNIKALKKYQPAIAEQFENYQVKRPIEFFCNENLIANLVFTDTNEIVYPYKNPVEYCKSHVIHHISKDTINTYSFKNDDDPYGQLHFKYFKACLNVTDLSQHEAIILKDLNVIPTFVCVGIDLGYHLNELYERLDIQQLILIEPNSDLFYASLYTFDWNNLLTYIYENNKKIGIFLDSQWDKLQDALTLYFVKHGVYKLFVNYFYTAPCSTNYLNLTQRIQYTWTNHKSLSFFDDDIFAINHSCTSILNHKHFVKKGNVDNKYRNLPVFIIGAGPSLDDDIAFLRANQDKALIIACGTAIDALYHAGIKPDFFASTERTPELYQLLEKIPDESFFDDIILLATDVCHPKLASFFKNTAIFSKYDEFFLTYLKINYPQIPEINVAYRINPLVANMAISAVLALGFTEFYLFGIDNGKKENIKAIHSSYTSLYKNYGFSEKVPEYEVSKLIKGNFEGSCNTNYIYKSCIDSITKSLRLYKEQNSEIKCINCSDGAFIPETIPMHSRELVNLFKVKEKIAKVSFKNYMNNIKTTELPLNLPQLKSVLSTETFRKLCDSIKNMIKKDYQSRQEIIESMQDISEFCDEMFSKISGFYTNLIMHSIQHFFIILNTQIFSFHDEKKCIAIANKTFPIITDFLTEAPEIFDYIPNYVIGEHRKFFKDGKIGRDMTNCKAPKLPEEINIIKRDYADPLLKFEKKYQ